MINRAILGAAVVAAGAGAVIFLSTAPSSARTPAVPAVQVVYVPATVTQAPTAMATLKAAEQPALAPKAAVAPAAQSSSKRAVKAPAPVRKAAPQQPAAQLAPVQQQPQPAGTEPNGTGGWQLPACYDPSCDVSGSGG